MNTEINNMNKDELGSTILQDELATSIQSSVRGTDLNGNYTFEPYSPKSPVTVSDLSYRVAKVMYKMNTKTKTIAGSNSCLIVPHFTDTEVMNNVARLMPHIIGMIESEQDKIIKDLHLSKVSFVEPSDISLDSIITALESEAVSGRINKEMIEAWFTSELEESLVLLIADKLGCNVEAYKDVSNKLYLTVQTYKNLFSKLASNTTQYQPKQAEQLKTAIVVCEADSTDSITIKLLAKLDKMINPVDFAELLDF